MKTTLLLTTLCGLAGAIALPAQAQDYGRSYAQGRVLSSVPVMQQVAVPQQVCNTSQVVTQAPPTGGGAVIGAIAGGLLGNTVGGGGGRALATMAGVVGGAMVGDRIEGSPGNQVQNVQQCGTQTSYENRATAYEVVYEYNGQQFQTRLPGDPGPFVQLELPYVAPGQVAATPNVLFTSTAPAMVTQTTYVNQPVYTAAPVMYGAPYYAPYYARPYYGYPPVGVSLNFGYSRGFGGGYRHGPGGRWR